MKSALTRSISARFISRAVCETPSIYCCGEAEIISQLPSLSGLSIPSQARRVDAFAPA